VSIISRHGVDTATEDRYRSFERKIPKLTDETLVHIIRDTNRLMRIRTTTDDTDPNLRTFSNDTLKIEICGPKQEQFTIVDVPGIFRVPSPPFTTDDDVRLVRDVIESYVKNTHSIIIAVLPSNVDITTQEILKVAEKADPDGLRTIAVLTKPDLVTEEVTQTAIKEIVLGRGKPLPMGCCVVKNRGADDQQSTVSDRLAQEKAFFGKPEWREIAASGRCGIESLKFRLSDLLLNLWEKASPIGKACFTPGTDNEFREGLSL
jgi:GTPase SAR1 family protein